jgi:tripartite ATP-independent transporter DctM subunit
MSFNKWFQSVLEFLAATLLLVELVVLSLGVYWRYVRHQPLTWSDELASVLFLWLGMLGAAIALHRHAHMRLTTLVDLLSPPARQFCDALVLLLGFIFSTSLLIPAYLHAQDQWMIVTPALEIPDGIRTVAVGFGLLIMSWYTLSQLFLFPFKRALGWAMAVCALMALALWLASPLLMQTGNVNLLLFFVCMVALMVAIGLPIAFAFGLSTMAYLIFSTSTPMTVVVSRMDEGMSHLILLSVPLFVFLGGLISVTGLAKTMVDFLATLLGHMRGGLQYVLLVAMYLVSGISGSKAADMAAVAPALFPEMKKRGADPGQLVALLAASGAMSETIPPSLVLITVGAVTGVSIAALFVGGLVPALVGLLALSVVVYFQSRHETLPLQARSTVQQMAKAFLIALPALSLPFVIRTAVVEGVATATEVSTIGIMYTLVIALLFFRPIPWRNLYPQLVESASLSGAILLIIGCATAMAWALTQSGFSTDLALWMKQLPCGTWGFMGASLIAFVLLGSLLEGIPAIVLFGPLLFPIAKQLGIHEVHYAMMVIFAMGLGLFAPPLGVGFYAACAIGQVNPNLAIRNIWIYLSALLFALLLIALFPWLSIGFL